MRFKLTLLMCTVSSVLISLPTFAQNQIQNNVIVPETLPVLGPKDIIEIPKEVYLQRNANKPSVSKLPTKPTVKITPDFTPLHLPEKVDQNAFLLPQNVGANGADFTSSRLIPLTADLTYPHTAIGRLFNYKPAGGRSSCSAAVIAPRLVLTAGHCVYDAKVGKYNTRWEFMPAFRDDKAPLRIWRGTYARAPEEWIAGQGKVPNVADYAIIEMEDQVIDGKTRTLGSVTGTFGFQTNKLMPNHLNIMGYPCNLDACQKMHQVTAESAKAEKSNNVVYGADMLGGASGGPWIQNFGAPAEGQTGGLNPAFNKIVGVSSWGYTGGKYLGLASSTLDTIFVNLYNSMCKHKAGNC